MYSESGVTSGSIPNTDISVLELTLTSNFQKERRNMDFEYFIKTFSACSIVKVSRSAEHIYYQIIWSESNRIKMVGYIDAELPPLVAIIGEIESYCEENPHNDLDLGNPVVRQTIGRMVACSLEPFGYTAYKKGNVPNKKSKFFKSASHYRYTGGESHKIVRSIEPV